MVAARFAMLAMLEFARQMEGASGGLNDKVRRACKRRRTCEQVLHEWRVQVVQGGPRRAARIAKIWEAGEIVAQAAIAQGAAIPFMEAWQRARDEGLHAPLDSYSMGSNRECARKFGLNARRAAKDKGEMFGQARLR